MDKNKIITTEERNPYIGLRPFEEENRDYFFGREDDIKLISNNLQAHRLTILYGPSGVGKSSVLQAGVVPYLRAFISRKKYRSDSKIIYFNDWRNVQEEGIEPHEALKQLVAEKLNLETGTYEHFGLSNLLLQYSEDYQFYFIFDQFEEYFLYHQNKEIDNKQSFDYQLIQLCNNKSLNVNIIVSIRSDGLDLLDRYKGEIPILFDHLLRLEKLDRENAELAIREPLEVFASRQDGQAVAISEALVEEMLTTIDADRVARKQGGTSDSLQPSAENSGRYEAPLLQLLMTKLWNEIDLSKEALEIPYKNSEALTQLIDQHFSDVIKGYSLEDQRIFASVFKKLVTPSRSKIAYRLVDLQSETVDYFEINSSQDRAVMALKVEELLEGLGLSKK